MATMGDNGSSLVMANKRHMSFSFTLQAFALQNPTPSKSRPRFLKAFFSAKQKRRQPLIGK
jgi:hypothetical protein